MYIFQTLVSWFAFISELIMNIIGNLPSSLYNLMVSAILSEEELHISHTNNFILLVRSTTQELEPQLPTTVSINQNNYQKRIIQETFPKLFVQHNVQRRLKKSKKVVDIRSFEETDPLAKTNKYILQSRRNQQKFFGQDYTTIRIMLTKVFPQFQKQSQDAQNEMIKRVDFLKVIEAYKKKQKSISLNGKSPLKPKSSDLSVIFEREDYYN